VTALSGSENTLKSAKVFEAYLFRPFWTGFSPFIFPQGKASVEAIIVSGYDGDGADALCAIRDVGGELLRGTTRAPLFFLNKRFGLLTFYTV
jgi:hypothetical protein